MQASPGPAQRSSSNSGGNYSKRFPNSSQSRRRISPPPLQHYSSALLDTQVLSADGRRHLELNRHCVFFASSLKVYAASQPPICCSCEVLCSVQGDPFEEDEDLQQAEEQSGGHLIGARVIGIVGLSKIACTCETCMCEGRLHLS